MKSSEKHRNNEEGNYIPTETARTISKDIYEIMIDEYQDSNLVQEIILNAVSGRGKNASPRGWYG